jgi:hypothetical protein
MRGLAGTLIEHDTGNIGAERDLNEADAAGFFDDFNRAVAGAGVDDDEFDFSVEVLAEELLDRITDGPCFVEAAHDDGDGVR